MVSSISGLRELKSINARQARWFPPLEKMTFNPRQFCFQELAWSCNSTNYERQLLVTQGAFWRSHQSVLATFYNWSLMEKIELWSSTLQRTYQQRHAQDWCVSPVCVLLSSVAFAVALVTMVKDRFCCHRRAQIAWYEWHSWVGPFPHEGTSDGHLCHQWKSWSQKHWGTSGFCTSLQCASSLFPLPCMNCAGNGMTQTQLRCKLGQPGGVERKSADPGFGTSHGGHILDYTQKSDF